MTVYQRAAGHRYIVTDLLENVIELGSREGIVIDFGEELSFSGGIFLRMEEFRDKFNEFCGP